MGELAIAVVLIAATYGIVPLLFTRLGRRFSANKAFDLGRPGAPLQMAGGLVLGWGIIALAFQWWWFSAVAIAGGAVLLLRGRSLRRK